MIRDGFAKFGLVVSAICVALLVSEGVVRLAGWAPALERLRVGGSGSVYTFSDNPILGYVLRANYRDDNADLHSSFPFTNAHGFRDIERTLNKPGDTRRVIVLGDSVVAGHGIQSLDDTISRQLERHLAGQGLTTEVLNMGIGGYCTRGEVELLKVKGIAFSPDVVVLVFVENDFDDLNSELPSLKRSAVQSQWSETLMVHSELFRMLTVRQKALERNHTHQESVSEHMDAVGNDNVAQGLAVLAALSKSHGFDVLVAIWPRFTETEILDVDLGHKGREGQGLTVERLAKANGLRTLRLSNAFKTAYGSEKNPGRSPRSLYAQQDGMHPSVKGAGIAARALAHELNK